MAQQFDYFHSLFILLSPANEIKAPTADMKFCGKVAFQKWLTTYTQENKDSWAFRGKLKPSEPHPCNRGCSTAGTGGTGMECIVGTAASPGSQWSPGLRGDQWFVFNTSVGTKWENSPRFSSAVDYGKRWLPQVSKIVLRTNQLNQRSKFKEIY